MGGHEEQAEKSRGGVHLSYTINLLREDTWVSRTAGGTRKIKNFFLMLNPQHLVGTLHSSTDLQGIAIQQVTQTFLPLFFTVTRRESTGLARAANVGHLFLGTKAELPLIQKVLEMWFLFRSDNDPPSTKIKQVSDIPQVLRV